MKLHSFWRSTCSWRVRIALAYKQIAHEYVPVNLGKGEHLSDEYTRKNPMRQVPVLELDDGTLLSQSMAILAYLDELQPEPPLLPLAPLLRARARQLAEIVTSGIQPLQNTSTQMYVRDQLNGDAPAFVRHFIGKGLTALEAQVGDGRFCVGDEVSLADLCLVPELGFARRFDFPLEKFPKLMRIEAACAELPAFQKAHADAQVDAPR